MIMQARITTDSTTTAGTRRLASLASALKDPDLPLPSDFVDVPEANYEMVVAKAVVRLQSGGRKRRGW